MVMAATPVFLIVTLPVFLSTAAIFGFELVKVILLFDVALILKGFAPYATLYKLFIAISNFHIWIFFNAIIYKRIWRYCNGTLTQMNHFDQLRIWAFLWAYLPFQPSISLIGI